MLMEFLIPNWHVFLIHFPLGLLVVGVIIELLSFLWRRGQVHSAGRWMILLGALLNIPAMTVGLYALRQQAVPGNMWPFRPWHELAATSHWSGAVWELMEEHIWFSAGGSLIAILMVVLHVACSDRLRRALYVPGLLLLVLAVGAIGAGAWHAGEAVYRHGVAVAAVTLAPDEPPSEPATEPAGEAETEPIEVPADTDHAPPPAGNDITWYIPPLELHLLLAGLTVAIVLGAAGLSIRQWTRPRDPPPATEAQGYPASSILQAMSRQPHPQVGQAPAPPTPEAVPESVFPARFWLMGILFALGTAAAGLWFTGDWELRAGLRRYVEDWSNAKVGEARLFWHVAAGIGMVVAMLLLALLTRFARRGAVITSMFLLLGLALVGAQVWLGILMLFDSRTGPLTGFNG